MWRKVSVCLRWSAWRPVRKQAVSSRPLLTRQEALTPLSPLPQLERDIFGLAMEPLHLFLWMRWLEHSDAVPWPHLASPVACGWVGAGG